MPVLQVRSFWDLLLSTVPRGSTGAPWYVLSAQVRRRISELGALVDLTGDFTRPFRHAILRSVLVGPPAA